MRIAPHNLTPASGRQDHTTSPSASATFVFVTFASTASHPAFATIMIRPSCGVGWRELVEMICPTGARSKILSSTASKNISLHSLVEAALLIPPSHPTRGAYHDRQERGVGCGGRRSVLRAMGLQGESKDS